MKEAVIVSAVRTPTGKFRGLLSKVPCQKLGAVAIAEAVRRAGIEPDMVEEVLMGNVISAGLGQHPARQSALLAGIPVDVGSTTVNKMCGSGLKTMAIAAQVIKAGDEEIIVAGGMENMDLAPYFLYKARLGYSLGDGILIDGMLRDGLTDAEEGYHMALTGEKIAEDFNLTREECDQFAYESQYKAAKATRDGKFKDEIIPVEVPVGKGETKMLDYDEGIRPDTTLEK